MVHTVSLIETNEELRLRWVDVEPLIVDGRSIDSPELKKFVSQIRVTLAMGFPPLRINREGKFLGTVSLKESMKTMEDLINKMFPDRPEESQKFLPRMAGTPEGQKMVDAIMQRYWSSWVQTWLGRDIRPGQVMTNNEIQKNPFGEVNLKATVTISHLGFDAIKTNEAFLKCEQVAGGEALVRGVLETLKAVSKSVDAPGENPLPQILDVQRTTVMEVKTDHTDMRPSWARFSTETTIETAEKGKRSQRESHEFKFIWEKQNQH